ncbi:hypothetical protein ACPF4W_002132 [Vibrio cholerae]|uniref:Uncharacterized protein n=1 Tax=Vibrio cholerae TaxID=666 RepID=A0A5C9SXZ1_VIBCL|nr:MULTISPECIES: hypothetical protein [Vibrio]MBJ6975836.1 hypothetical protein [Vibrio cholerae]MBP8549615.1 hypothetical protein [Vibrio paracholerae]MEB5529097.1 hypothetical protein [Vibrio cholerae]RNE58179.1 hypothetical protein EEJ33_19610 [Vibrio cholerae]TXY17855.1 hypothetical protein FXE92_14870 [Vibrio cholerae]
MAAKPLHQEHTLYAPELVEIRGYYPTSKALKNHPLVVTDCKACKLKLVQPENGFNSLILMN